MYYIEETDNEVVKYEVKLDTDRLKSLKEEIIEKCSEIDHRCYESDYEPGYDFFETHHIENYHSTKTGKTKEYFEETRDIYKIEYDEYKSPLIVDYIDILINGDTTVIPSLKHYSSFSHPLGAVRESEKAVKCTLINYLNKPLEEIEIESLTQSIHTLSCLKEDIIKNKNQKSVSVYYDDVMKCITLTEVDRMDKAAIRRVEGFQGISYTKKNK